MSSWSFSEAALLTPLTLQVWPCHHWPMGGRTLAARRSAAEYEFHHLLIPRGMSRSAARRVLSEHAEYGHWEIAQLRMFPDGTRKVTLRRRIMRINRPPTIPIF